MRKRGLVKTKEKGKEKRFTASIGRASLPGPCADDEGKKKRRGGGVDSTAHTYEALNTDDGWRGRAYQDEKEEEEERKKRADAERKREGKRKNMADSRQEGPGWVKMGGSC